MAVGSLGWREWTGIQRDLSYGAADEAGVMASITETRIREMILEGHLPCGERLREVELAERLGVSRQPIRQALPALAREGLLERVGARGYAVRQFTLAEALTALELRATLEGVAARVVAEQGLSTKDAEEFDEYLSEGDALLDGEPDDDLNSRYGFMNSKFHGLLVKASGRRLIHALLQQCEIVPFVSPAVIAFAKVPVEQVRPMLRYAHQQHHAIVDALRNQEGSRAEALMREHATTQVRSMHLNAGTSTDLSIQAVLRRQPPRAQALAAAGEVRTEALASATSNGIPVMQI